MRGLVKVDSVFTLGGAVTNLVRIGAAAGGIGTGAPEMRQGAANQR